MAGMFPGGGGSQLSTIQNQMNQQALDQTAAVTSRQQTETTMQKMHQQVQNEKVNMFVEQAQFSTRLVGKIDLSR